MSGDQTLQGYAVHNCHSMNAYNALADWRNSGELGERCVKSLVAEFAFAGLAVLALAQCVAKVFGSAILMQVPYTKVTGYRWSNDAGFAFQTALCSLSSLIANIFQKRLWPIPLCVNKAQAVAEASLDSLLQTEAASEARSGRGRKRPRTAAAV